MEPGPVEAVGSHVAAGNGPFVVLFRKHGADETDDGGPVGGSTRPSWLAASY